jgi:hypothetical protein
MTGFDAISQSPLAELAEAALRVVTSSEGRSTSDGTVYVRGEEFDRLCDSLARIVVTSVQWVPGLQWDGCCSST